MPWAVPLAVVLPLLGLALLLVRPELDMEWEHHPSHFWIVLLTAAVSVALAYITNVAAGRYRDARLVLISFSFLSAAGFLGLHALATPGVLLDSPNAGFSIATPVGLGLAVVLRCRVDGLDRRTKWTHRPACTTGHPRRPHRADGPVGRPVAPSAASARRPSSGDGGRRAC